MCVLLAPNCISVWAAFELPKSILFIQFTDLNISIDIFNDKQ